jgi:hypothetical protein
VDRTKPKDWTIASYVPSHAYEPRTRAALAGLGYRIIQASTIGRFDDDNWKPDLRIVDERHFDKLPAENYLPRTPIIVLVGANRNTWRDPRVVGQITRPASLDAIYPLIQAALEDHPRGSARATTQLPARCTRVDRRWMGAIVSLSASGCLFQTQSEMKPGLELNMHFPLPRDRMVYTRARVLRRMGKSVGMQFSDPPEASQQAIGDFVAERLAAASL